MNIQPYLFFNGHCDEAIEFYRSVFEAEVVALMRYRENPDSSMIPPGAEDKVMHSQLRIGETTIMASDGCAQGDLSFQGFSLSLTVDDEAAAERLFGVLAEAGEIQMPLAQTFFSPRFGIVADRFGVSWMIYVAP